MWGATQIREAHLHETMQRHREIDRVILNLADEAADNAADNADYHEGSSDWSWIIGRVDEKIEDEVRAAANDATERVLKVVKDVLVNSKPPQEELLEVILKNLE